MTEKIISQEARRQSFEGANLKDLVGLGVEQETMKLLSEFGAEEPCLGVSILFLHD